MDFKQTYFNLWAAAWEFHKKYATPGDTGEFWEQLVNESGEIMKEYEDKPEHDFIKDLVVAIVAEIERVSKRQRENKDNEKKI